MLAGSDRDREAFAQRSQGRSFGAIARELGFDNAPAATEAFLRVLRAENPDVQRTVRDDEHQRLDVLAVHVKADESLEPTAMERRLGVIDRMRKDLDTV